MGLAPRLLRRHVAGSAHQRAAARLLRVALDPFGKAEVGDLGRALVRQQHVGGLQVAVDDAPLMRKPHCPCQRFEDLGRALRLQRLPRDGVCQGPPFDELERKKRQPVAFANLEDLDDVGVLKTGDGFALDAEPLELALSGVLAGDHHLQRDEPVESLLTGLVDDPHAAST